MKRFFRRFKYRVIVLQRDPMKLRLHEWRSDLDLIRSAQKVFVTTEFRWCLDVVRNEHPAFNVLPDDAPPHVRIAHQARAEGYTLALSNLEALAKYEEPRVPMEATFEEPEPVESL